MGSYLVHYSITFTLPKRSPRDYFTSDKDNSNEIPNDDMILFQPTNVKSIIHYKKDSVKTFDYKVHNLTTRFKVTHKWHS